MPKPKPTQRAKASSSSSGNAGGAGGSGREVLSMKGASAMADCIDLLFGRWTALQLAVQYRWGGNDSQAKTDRLASSVLSWFTGAAARGTGPLDEYELEGLLYDTMDESFNADIEDGSVEEITKHLMTMYTHCLGQNYSYIGKLRKTGLAGSAITKSKEVLGRNDSDEIAPSEEEEGDYDDDE